MQVTLTPGQHMQMDMWYMLVRGRAVIEKDIVAVTGQPCGFLGIYHSGPHFQQMGPITGIQL